MDGARVRGNPQPRHRHRRSGSTRAHGDSRTPCARSPKAGRRPAPRRAGRGLSDARRPRCRRPSCACAGASRRAPAPGPRGAPDGPGRPGARLADAVGREGEGGSAGRAPHRGPADGAGDAVAASARCVPRGRRRIHHGGAASRHRGGPERRGAPADRDRDRGDAGAKPDGHALRARGLGSSRDSEARRSGPADRGAHALDPADRRRAARSLRCGGDRVLERRGHAGRRDVAAVAAGAARRAVRPRRHGQRSGRAVDDVATPRGAHAGARDGDARRSGSGGGEGAHRPSRRRRARRCRDPVPDQPGPEAAHAALGARRDRGRHDSSEPDPVHRVAHAAQRGGRRGRRPAGGDRRPEARQGSQEGSPSPAAPRDVDRAARAPPPPPPASPPQTPHPRSPPPARCP